MCLSNCMVLLFYRSKNKNSGMPEIPTFSNSTNENKQVIHDDPHSGIYEEIASVLGESPHTYETLNGHHLHYPDKHPVGYQDNPMIYGSDNPVIYGSDNPALSYLQDTQMLPGLLANNVSDRSTFIRNGMPKHPPPIPPMPKNKGVDAYGVQPVHVGL